MAGRHRALLVLCTADVLVALDGMIVTVALPAIQRHVGFSAGALQWVVTAYTFTLGGFLLAGGRLADRWGAHRTLAAGLGLFAAGSLAAGLARSPGVLLAARSVTGLGAATAIPAALSLIASLYDDEEDRHRALGWQSAGMDAGLVAGAALGGAITSALGWPWVFLLVVPVAVAAALGALRVVPPSARRDAAPAGPLTLLRDRRVRNADLAIVANAGGFGSTVFLASLHMQRELGWSAAQAGLGFVPLAVSAGLAGPAAARLVARFGVRDTVSASLAATAACLLWLAHGGGYVGTVLPAFLVGGMTFATAAVPLTAEAVDGPDDKGTAAGLFQTFTHAGGAVVLTGVAAVAASLGLRAGFALVAALLAAGAVHSAVTLRSRLARAGC
jgi:predicted MFS family arabinose efflux permease